MAIVKNTRGQGVTEYVLLLAIITTVFIGAVRMLNKSQIAVKFTDKLLKKPFAAAYRYGKKEAKSYSEGAPSDHPRITAKGNFRIFLNPTPK